MPIGNLLLIYNQNIIKDWLEAEAAAPDMFQLETYWMTVCFIVAELGDSVRNDRVKL